MKLKMLLVGLIVLIIAASSFFLLMPKNASDPSFAKDALVESVQLMFEDKFDHAQSKLDQSEFLGMEKSEIHFWQTELLVRKAEAEIDTEKALLLYQEAMNSATQFQKVKIQQKIDALK